MNDDKVAQDLDRGRAVDSSSPLLWLSALLLVLTLIVFFAVTPSGVLGKTSMVGYAVCHQIDSHSFNVAGHQLPLCARCTGTFLGALVGLLGQAVVLRRRRAAAFPPPLVVVFLIGFTLSWAADGLNATLALVGGPHLYEPRNAFRLVTGLLNGVTMSALIYPVFNVSLWRRPAETPTFRGLRDLATVLLMEMLVVALVLSGWDWLLHPLAVLSALSVLTLLTSVNTVIALILLGRENSVERWREAILPITLGLILSLIQVGMIDLVRFGLTGTLEGFGPFQ